MKLWTCIPDMRRKFTSTTEREQTKTDQSKWRIYCKTTRLMDVTCWQTLKVRTEGCEPRTGLSTKDQGERTEHRGPSTEEQGQRTKDRGPSTEDQGQRTKDRGPSTGDQGQRTKDRGPSTGTGRSTGDQGQRTKYGQQVLDDQET
ncbi:hypothetical protein ACROYT_G032600 [Oculina patagonica]